jgi:hypothetical protein
MAHKGLVFHKIEGALFLNDLRLDLVSFEMAAKVGRIDNDAGLAECRDDDPAQGRFQVAIRNERPKNLSAHGSPPEKLCWKCAGTGSRIEKGDAPAAPLLRVENRATVLKTVDG